MRSTTMQTLSPFINQRSFHTVMIDDLVMVTVEVFGDRDEHDQSRHNDGESCQAPDAMPSVVQLSVVLSSVLYRNLALGNANTRQVQIKVQVVAKNG